jgi:hypothetical protein
MELFSAAFYPAVLTVLDDPRLLVLGTVPVARYGRTIPQVGTELFPGPPEGQGHLSCFILESCQDGRGRPLVASLRHVGIAQQYLQMGARL